ncbi:MAG TPA: acyl-ACP--UDP-N-acetylglucosamine O-acyltransferase [Ignavibacteriaceae bacterium]|nr:acyl-ACP--UDP-N-acetylglucosamine O-acyltransferase [Ignavibacteriaceae bacterium]
MKKIHPSSIIDPKAEIADEVEIGPFCVVEGDVRIGKGTRLLNNVSVFNGARLGENNVIYPGASISTNPQDLKYSGEYTEAFIGNGNSIRECVTISRATIDTKKTIIGNNCLLMAYSHVAHDCIVENHCILANSVALAGHVVLEEYTILGGLVGVHQFVRIGQHAMIGAHSMVVKDVPPFSLFSGNPLEYNGLNLTGLRRRNFSDESIEALKKAYTFIFTSNLNTTQALEKIQTEVNNCEEVNHLIKFIRESRRGISK